MPYTHRTRPATGYQKADDGKQMSEGREQIFQLQIAQLYALCFYKPATRDSQPATRYLSTTIAIPIPPPMHMVMSPVL